MNVTVEIQDEDIYGLLACAFEGGIGYWATIKCYEGFPTSQDWPIYCTLPVMDNAVILCLNDDSTTTPEEYRLDRSAILRGFAVMSKDYPKHFANFIQDAFDAETGDVFVQCCLFGKVIYG